MRNSDIEEAAAYVNQHYPESPEVGIILGTGLGNLVESIQVEKIIEYSSIPHFVIPTVETHDGKMLFGKLGGKSIVALQGRFHYYEGYSMKEITFPVYVLKALGIKKLFISNAAGNMNMQWSKGDLMLIDDHINLQPENPLRGKNDDSVGFRFPPYQK